MSTAAQLTLERRVADLEAIELLLDRMEEMFPMQLDVRAQILYDFAQVISRGKDLQLAVRCMMQQWELGGGHV